MFLKSKLQETESKELKKNIYILSTLVLRSWHFRNLSYLYEKFALITNSCLIEL